MNNEQEVLRKLAASCRRLSTAIKSNRPAQRLELERHQLVTDMSAVLEEMGLCANAQLLLNARHKFEQPEPSESPEPPEIHA